MPLKRVTVWAGTSWLKATRKLIWRGIVPAIVVSLGWEKTWSVVDIHESIRKGSRGKRRRGERTSSSRYE